MTIVEFAQKARVSKYPEYMYIAMLFEHGSQQSSVPI